MSFESSVHNKSRLEPHECMNSEKHLHYARIRVMKMYQISWNDLMGYKYYDSDGLEHYLW